jgi:isocitrate dehydrogenase
MNPISSTPRITVAHGDGIGPEIMKATLDVLRAAGAQFEVDEVKVGEAAYLSGVKNGIPPEAWEIIKRNPVFLKAPITTPEGGGYKSLNVTIRKALRLYANVRPNRAFAPFVPTFYPNMDLVIIRENEEDLYAGIEHQQTPSSVQALKLVTREGCEAIVRYAFEYAKANNRKKVTCLSKDNIMKQTDGLFHHTFDRIAKEYPELQTEHYIVDIGMARVAARPESFDVIVTLNLYGDILSDIAAEVAGSVGVAGSANIGPNFAMFEAIHGSAPRIAGQDSANPSGLLNAAVMMLVHIGQIEAAAKITNAWLKTLEDGIHTKDIYREGVSKEKVGTQRFAKEVIARLGQVPARLKAVEFRPTTLAQFKVPQYPAVKKEVVGLDVFIYSEEKNPTLLGQKIEGLCADGLRLASLANRGIKVYPAVTESVYCSDLYRAQFLATAGTITNAQIVAQLDKLAKAGVDFVQTQQLCTFDGQRAYSAAQGD